MNGLGSPTGERLRRLSLPPDWAGSPRLLPPQVPAPGAPGDPENVFGMLEAGARGYMLKDADPEQIAEGIRAEAVAYAWQHGLAQD